MERLSFPCGPVLPHYTMYNCISKDISHLLFVCYRYDFVLFGYSPDEYVAIGNDEVTPLVCRK